LPAVLRRGANCRANANRRNQKEVTEAAKNPRRPA
jgi:hypothetical protein